MSTQAPQVESVVQDKALMLGAAPEEGPAVEGAREMFTYLHQYITSLEAEVRLQAPYCHSTSSNKSSPE